MAGSWKHTVTEDGKLLSNVDLTGMLEISSGDVYEYAKEAYGMVWYLATRLATEKKSAEEWIETARKLYKSGLELSPGIAEDGESSS